MKSLSIALERLSFNLHQAKKGLITPTTRSRAATRRATRARLGLECLETRDLMSGMTLANPVSGPTPAPSFQGTPILLPPASLAATPESPTEINLVWNDEVDSANGPTLTTVYEQSGTGGWAMIASMHYDPKLYAVTGLNPDSTYDFYVNIAGTTFTEAKRGLLRHQHRDVERGGCDHILPTSGFADPHRDGSLIVGSEPDMDPCFGSTAVHRELVAEPRRSSSIDAVEPEHIAVAGHGPEPLHKL